MADFPEIPPYQPSAPEPGPPAPAARVIGWAHPDRMRCPLGHLITRRDTMLTGTLIVRCECGRAMLALAAAPLLRPGMAGDRLVFLAEISRAEAQWVKAENPSIYALLDLLGQLRG